MLVVGVLLQGSLLAVWASGHPLQQAGSLSVALAAALLLHRGAAAARPACVEMAVLGGAGMALGAWIDSGFLPPPCLCCLHFAGGGVLGVLRQAVSSAALGLMLLLPLLYRAAGSASRRLPLCGAPARRLLGDSVGMLVGMATAAWIGSHALRHLEAGKLEAGHVLMVLGMVLGCAGGRAPEVAADPGVPQPPPLRQRPS